MPTCERNFLIFFMNAERYAFDLGHIAEVMDSASSWPIPFAPPYYRGVINFHGAIVAVMDLAEFLGFDSCPGLEKVVVLNSDLGSLGFLIERIARIVPEHEIEIRSAPEARFASASLRLPEGDATLLDIVTIVGAAENSVNSYP